MSRTALRICPLCEATCGLELTIEGDRGHRRPRRPRRRVQHGFICPKGATFGAAGRGPRPAAPPAGPRGRRAARGHLGRGLRRGRAGPRRRSWSAHGRDAVGVYLGNPNVHTMAGALYLRRLLSALGTRNLFSASTVDQMPKHVSCGLLFGDAGAIPVPDLDRTDYLLMLGANPLESNGSLCTRPTSPAGSRRSRPAAARSSSSTRAAPAPPTLADEHVAIRPGTDALLLAAWSRSCSTRAWSTPATSPAHVDGLDELPRRRRRLHPRGRRRRLRRATPDDIRAPRPRAGRRAHRRRLRPHRHLHRPRSARWPAGSSTSSTCSPATSTGPAAPCSRSPPPTAPRRAAGAGRGFTAGRWHSRVRGLPEVKGEMPVATLADEIETPGEGQVRALIDDRRQPGAVRPRRRPPRRRPGRPGLHGQRRPVPQRDHPPRRRHPAAAPARAEPALRLRASTASPCATWSATRRPALPAGRRAGWTSTRSSPGWSSPPPARRATPTRPPSTTMVARQPARHAAAATRARPVHGRDPRELAARLTGADGPERLLDLMLRLGPYGDGFGADPTASRWPSSLEHPHGIDLGPLRPRLPERAEDAAAAGSSCCPAPIAGRPPPAARGAGRAPRRRAWS